MPYEFTHTEDDVLRERFILGANLTGKYDFPQLESIQANLEGLKPVPLNLARQEKEPKKSSMSLFY